MLPNDGLVIRVIDAADFDFIQQVPVKIHIFILF